MIQIQHFPNTDAVIRQLAMGDPSHTAQQWKTYALYRLRTTRIWLLLYLFRIINVHVDGVVEVKDDVNVGQVVDDTDVVDMDVAMDMIDHVNMDYLVKTGNVHDVNKPTQNMSLPPR